MLRLTSLIYPIVGTALAGTCVTAALVMGASDWGPILGAACIGALAALPVSLVVARKLVTV